MYKQLKNKDFYRLLGFGPCVIITSSYGKKVNAAPIAWTMPVNDEPPLVAIAVASGHYTRELIEKSGEFVINIADKKMLPTIKFCGGVSGRKVDKIKAAGIKLEKGILVDTPHLKGCPGFIECKVRDNFDYRGVRLFVAAVLRAAVKKNLWKNDIIAQKANLVHHVGGNVFATLGRRFKMT